MKICLLLVLSLILGCSAFGQTKRKSVRPRPKRIRTARVIKKPLPSCVASRALKTKSGINYIITECGGGEKLKSGETVTVHYTGLLTDGTKFDSSLDRNKPFSFPLGAGKVIKGWDEGVSLLHVGDRATFIIPSSLGYGKRGAGGVIPPDASLIFIIEVVGIADKM
jgi:FKBP-type peptidyl-prolyl cis-trans isomerase